MRRKLEGLAQRGWVERDANGLWHIRTDDSELTPAKRELIDIDRRGMEQLCQFLGKMHALASEAQTRGATDPPTKPRQPVWTVRRTKVAPGWSAQRAEKPLTVSRSRPNLMAASMRRAGHPSSASAGTPMDAQFGRRFALTPRDRPKPNKRNQIELLGNSAADAPPFRRLLESLFWI